MKISRFTVNPYGENTYILCNDTTHDALIIDPGMSNETERNAVDKYIEDNKLNVKKILLTHQHVDHVISVSYLADKYKCPIAAHKGDSELGASLQSQANMLGVPGKMQPFMVSEELADEQNLELDGEKIIALWVPGHSEGGMAFYIPDSNCVFVGDSLFEQSIGRTDLPGGDYATLINSLRTKLLNLPEDTAVYPGHGSSTTIGDEKMYNPFLR